MSTKLKFVAPSDLSVGRVSVVGAEGPIADWIATPSKKVMKIDDIAPGIYTAVIEPLGQPSRPYVFKVEPGRSNNVVTPALSVLAAQGISGELFSPSATTSFEEALVSSGPTTTTMSPLSEEPREAARVKSFAIGLSQDEEPARHGGWRPYSGSPEPSVELLRGELHVLIDRTSAPLTGSTGQRLRLSASIQATRVERMMVPLFAGGTRIVFTASRLTTADLTFRVIPMNPERRALTQALQSGTVAEAQAVRDDVLKGGSIARFIGGKAQEDPWAAVTAALLTIRFPELFGAKESSWAPELVRRYPWLPDVHILAARQELVMAGSGTEARLKAARAALNAIQAARQLGAPYFTYANQLIGELLGALASTNIEEIREQCEKEMLSWRADVPLQRSAGAIFSWLQSDPRKKKDTHEVAPYTPTRGSLDERYSRILFRGQIDLTQIGIKAPSDDRRAAGAAGAIASTGKKGAGPGEGKTGRATKTGPRSARARSPSQQNWPDPPALRRRIKLSDDSNKGRFGGLAEKDGYRLDAEFSGKGRWIGVNLKVTADPSRHPPSYAEMVEFFLHDSFDPPRLSAVFQGHQAKLKVFATGGFTVGAWLPARGIELELDLATLPGAPRPIREL